MNLIDHKLFKFISKVFASYVRRNVSLSTEANTYTHIPTHPPSLPEFKIIALMQLYIYACRLRFCLFFVK